MCCLAQGPGQRPCSVNCVICCSMEQVRTAGRAPHQGALFPSSGQQPEAQRPPGFFEKRSGTLSCPSQPRLAGCSPSTMISVTELPVVEGTFSDVLSWPHPGPWALGQWSGRGAQPGAFSDLLVSCCLSFPHFATPTIKSSFLGGCHAAP